MSSDFGEKARQIDLDNRALFQAAPDTMGAYRTLMTQAGRDGALDGKTKELMALAIAVATRCEGCIVYHARAAVQKGAARDEVVETVEVAVEMGGGPAALYGGRALAAFDEFAGN